MKFEQLPLDRAAGSILGHNVYDDSGRRALRIDRVTTLCRVALAAIDRSIATNRRDDGLYHAYNVLGISSSGVSIGRLDVMLEGQVAVLSSGALGSHEAESVLKALRSSPLYREDQHSYVLYPDRLLPSFFDKNTIDPAEAARSQLMKALVRDGNTDRAMVALDQVNTGAEGIDLVRYYTLRGMAHMRRSEHEPARDAFEQAVAPRRHARVGRDVVHAHRAAGPNGLDGGATRAVDGRSGLGSLAGAGTVAAVQPPIRAGRVARLLRLRLRGHAARLGRPHRGPMPMGQRRRRDHAA